MARTPVLSRPRAVWAWAWLGGLLGVLLAILLFAPARWLASSVESATGRRVVLADPRGTVWTGSAQLLLTGGAGSTDAAALPSRIDWRLRPGLGGISVQLQTTCCITQPARLFIAPRWGGTKVTVADSQALWPAALLAGLGTPWNTLQLDGNIQIQTRGLSVEWIKGRLSVAGSAELTAHGMSSRLSTLRPLGSYRVALAGGGVPALTLDTLEGSLNLSGRGQWVGSRLRFSGTASAASGSEEALANLLNIIGRRSGSASIITIG